MNLTVATCQFPISSDIQSNLTHISRQIQTANEHDADVVHFPEACLSGYAGVDFSSYEDFDWELLRESTENVIDLARENRIWVILGSTHPLSDQQKPHNSLYIINSNGEITDRYDKRFCSGNQSDDPVPYNDLAYYNSGDHFSIFSVRGVTCGALICYDYRFSELYREYKRRGVQLMFHSYHAGNVPAPRFAAMQDEVGKDHANCNPRSTIPGITMPATMIARAANNHMWISCPNSSAKESCWPSFFVRPDGVVTGRLRRNEAGVLVSTVNTDQSIYDSTADWRDRAMDGVFHSGTLVSDTRSDDRTQL